MKKRRSDSRLHRGRVLDVALVQDPRNDDFRMQAVFGSAAGLPLASKEWICPVTLDQGSEGACVGFAGAHWFGSERFIQKVTTKIARMFYKGAQKCDEWAGENYEGTSVNGLIKYLQSKGYIKGCRWIRTMDELKRTLSLYGPVIVGCEWREGCFDPDREGFITFSGELRGGHATEWRGWNREEGYFIIQQSWGDDHGIKGTVKMREADVVRLLATRPQIASPKKKPFHQGVTLRRWWQFWK